jgi:K+-sensing histidine kinase KdpD
MSNPDDDLDDEPGSNSPLGGRRRHTISKENRPTRLLSDQVQVHALLSDAHQLALTRSPQEALDLAVAVLGRHTRSRWAAAWRIGEGGERVVATEGIDSVPIALIQLLARHRGTCTSDHASGAPSLVATPITVGDRIVGGMGLELQEGEASEDELLTLEFVAALCAVGQEHGQMLGAEERQREAAQEAKRSQSDFLSMVSHDVRGPLSVIKGYAQMLGQSRDQLPTDKQDLMLGKVVEQAERIERLVNGILDVARSESGKLRLSLERLDVTEVVRRALSLVDADGVYHLIAPDEPIMAMVDRLRIEQVVANLVGNALKYGAAPYRIHLAQDAENWQMAVIDSGEGIDAQRRGHLFERFAEGAKNVGLGLSIVQVFVEAHGGLITYDLRERGGAGHNHSAFCVRVPLGRPGT